MSTGINRDEWLAAVKEAEEALHTQDTDAITTREFMALTGLGSTTAKKRLSQWAETGKVVATEKYILNSRGFLVKVLAYRLVKP